MKFWNKKRKKRLRYSTMEHSTFESAFIIEIHHHGVISAEKGFECAAQDLPVLPP